MEARSGTLRPMHLPGGKTLLYGIAAVGGLALGKLALAKAEGGQIGGQPADLIAGGALLAASLALGGDGGKLAFVAGAAALAPTLSSKILETAGVTVAGYPYAVGELPPGAQVYALPQGYQPQMGYANVAQAAGLV